MQFRVFLCVSKKVVNANSFSCSVTTLSRGIDPEDSDPEVVIPWHQLSDPEVVW